MKVLHNSMAKAFGHVTNIAVHQLGSATIARRDNLLLAVHQKLDQPEFTGLRNSKIGGEFLFDPPALKQAVKVHRQNVNTGKYAYHRINKPHYAEGTDSYEPQEKRRKQAPKKDKASAQPNKRRWSKAEKEAHQTRILAKANSSKSALEIKSPQQIKQSFKKGKKGKKGK